MANIVGQTIAFLKIKKCKIVKKERGTLKLSTNGGDIIYKMNWEENALLLNGLAPTEILKINPWNEMDEVFYIINKWELNKEINWKADWVGSDWGE